MRLVTELLFVVCVCLRDLELLGVKVLEAVFVAGILYASVFKERSPVLVLAAERKEKVKSVVRVDMPQQRHREFCDEAKMLTKDDHDSGIACLGS